MRDIRFTNPKTGVQYKRISKKEAKKRFMAGSVMIIAPCNLQLFTNWGGWALLDGGCGTNDGKEFDATVNLFTYYNCNYELGYYPSFYVVV